MKTRYHQAAAWVAAAALLLCGAAASAQSPERWVNDQQDCKHANVGKPGSSVSWTGGCVDGLAEGEGTQQWSLNGAETTAYVGAMARGLRHGQGTLSLERGGGMEGNFVNGRLAGAYVFIKPNGERSEMDMSRRSAGIGSAVKAGTVCTRMASPQVPQVGWKGDAAYRVQATVKDGRVVSAEFLSLVGGVPREVDRRLRSAIIQAMGTSYLCPGDHVFEQEFKFSLNG